jgi:choline-phosphate cytidylyltransferase
VDEVYEGAPWIINESIYLIYTEFLTDNNIDYVAHDDIPYVTADTEDAYAECKRVGKFIATQRTQGISTSDLVTRIIADRDKYLSLIEYWIFILKQKYCPRRAVPAKPKKE